MSQLSSACSAAGPVPVWSQNITTRSGAIAAHLAVQKLPFNMFNHVKIATSD